MLLLEIIGQSFDIATSVLNLHVWKTAARKMREKFNFNCTHWTQNLFLNFQYCQRMLSTAFYALENCIDVHLQRFRMKFFTLLLAQTLHRRQMKCKKRTAVTNRMKRRKRIQFMLKLIYIYIFGLNLVQVINLWVKAHCPLCSREWQQRNKKKLDKLCICAQWNELVIYWVLCK